MSNVSNIVPKGWNTAPISEICNIAIGGTPSRSVSEYWDSAKTTGSLWVSIRDLSTPWIYETSEYITDLGIKNSNVKLVKKGTVLMSFKLSVGRVAFAGRDLYTNEAIVAFLPKDKGQLSNQFLYQGLQQWNLLENIDQAVKGITLNKEKINQIEALLPPLPEQQKIATILSSVDGVIEKTCAQIDKLKDLKTGMMQELLTKGIGHTEFKDSPVGRIPLSWSIAELRDVCTSKYAVVDGPFGSNLKTEHYRPTGIPVFQSGFVTSGRFVKREYVYVDAEKYNEQIRSSAGPGDILMAKIGMNAGACAIIPEDHSVGILAGNSLKMTVDIDKISNTYLLSILHLMRYTSEMRRLLTETAQPAVSITTLKSLKLALPPLQEQHEITGALNSIDSKYTSIVEKLVHLKQIKKALMQDLLTGKVRVNLTDKESAVV